MLSFLCDLSSSFIIIFHHLFLSSFIIFFYHLLSSFFHHLLSSFLSSFIIFHHLSSSFYHLLSSFFFLSSFIIFFYHLLSSLLYHLSSSFTIIFYHLFHYLLSSFFIIFYHLFAIFHHIFQYLLSSLWSPFILLLFFVMLSFISLFIPTLITIHIMLYDMMFVPCPFYTMTDSRSEVPSLAIRNDMGVACMIGPFTAVAVFLYVFCAHDPCCGCMRCSLGRGAHMSIHYISATSLLRPPTNTTSESFIMPLNGIDACKRALRVTRAQFQRGLGDLREVVRKRSKCVKKTRGHLRRLEAKLKDMGGTLSEEVSDGSSVLCDTSDSESSTASEDNKATASSDSKGVTRDMTVDGQHLPKAKAAAAAAPKVQAKSVPKAKAKVAKGETPSSTRRSKHTFPEVPPGEHAPLHKGKPNAEGVLYPGYPKGHPMRCEACEQLRRGFTRSSKSHREQCAWKVRG